MRQVIIKTEPENIEALCEIARQLDARNLIHWEQPPAAMLMAHLKNDKITDFLAQSARFEQAEIVLNPNGVWPFHPPVGEIPKQIKDVASRSPLEIYMNGIQSVGSWWGFIGYALAAGLIVWIGLYTNSIYLLTAAMLIAPFAGPAMNTAMATSAGDLSLLRDCLLRYFVSIFAAMLTNVALTLIFGLEFPTNLMNSAAQISRITVLLPLVAGFAGALNQIQSKQDSLVSGAAVGILVAASLAPPVGIMGISLVIGEWNMWWTSTYLVVLQLTGIHLSASLTFRYYGGMHEEGPRFWQGLQRLFPLAISSSFLLLASLVIFQLSYAPHFNQRSIAYQTEAIIKKRLKSFPDMEYSDIAVEITKQQINNKYLAVCHIYLLPATDSHTTPDEIKLQVMEDISREIDNKELQVQPYFHIETLGAPKP